MRLSPRTVDILKNFSSINKNLLVRPGNVLSTMNMEKTVFAKATVVDDFETQFGIYDLPRFLGVLSLFAEPELTFQEKSVLIKDSNTQKVNYVYADPSNMIVPGEKGVNFPGSDVSFDISKEQLSSILDARSVLQLPEIAIIGDGTSLSLRVINSKDKSSDEYTMVVGDSDIEFNMTFNPENWKMIKDSYSVSLNKKGMIKFSNSDLEYYIASLVKG